MTKRGHTRLGLAILVCVSACGSPPPTQPSGVAQPAPAAAPPAVPSIRHFDGVVTDGDSGGPIVGATMSALNSTLPPVATDGNGYYALDVPRTGGNYPGDFVSMKKAGYDSWYTWVPGQNDGRHDFKLYPARTVTAGTDTSFAITGDNSLCGLSDEFRCRSIHVFAPAAGTLSVSITSDDPGGPSFVVIGDLTFPYPMTRTQAQTPVMAGDTVTALIIRNWDAPSANFSLKTALSN